MVPSWHQTYAHDSFKAAQHNYSHLGIYLDINGSIVLFSCFGGQNVLISIIQWNSNSALPNSILCTLILRAAFSCKNCFAQLLCAYSLGVYFLWKKNSEKAACKMSVILTTGRNQGFSALLPNKIKGQESWAKLEACTQWDSSMAKSTNFWRIFSFRLLIW